LFTTGEDKRGIAIAAGEGFVCVLHADSRARSGGKKSLNRTACVGALVGLSPKRCAGSDLESFSLSAARQYTHRVKCRTAHKIVPFGQLSDFGLIPTVLEVGW
jgi:hypothetical protein